MKLICIDHNDVHVLGGFVEHVLPAFIKVIFAPNACLVVFLGCFDRLSDAIFALAQANSLCPPELFHVRFRIERHLSNTHTTNTHSRRK